MSTTTPALLRATQRLRVAEAALRDARVSFLIAADPTSDRNAHLREVAAELATMADRIAQMLS